VRYADVGQLVNNLRPLLPASASLSVNQGANGASLRTFRSPKSRDI
jgi:hypothetical protein